MESIRSRAVEEQVRDRNQSRLTPFENRSGVVAMSSQFAFVGYDPQEVAAQIRSDGVKKGRSFGINTKRPENAESMPSPTAGRKRYCGYGSFHM